MTTQDSRWIPRLVMTAVDAGIEDDEDARDLWWVDGPDYIDLDEGLYLDEPTARLFASAPDLLARVQELEAVLRGVLAFEETDSLLDQHTDAALRQARERTYERARALLPAEEVKP